MLWLEMSRDPAHGGGNWGFALCLWSPARKNAVGSRSAPKWAFWETLLEVRAGDPVLHLRGVGDEAAFAGFSTAETDGFETSERPPIPGQWDYADRFYRVILKDYTPFPKPVPLRDVFLQQEAALRDYFHRNKAKSPGEKKRVFYVVQAGKLQCLNGAYLSEVDDELAGILLGSDYTDGTAVSRPLVIQVETGERIQELRTRVGQKEFSDGVRANFQSRCCFPGCSVDEDKFLVSAHIARWADAPELRGELSNGLCFCLMHDRAFEIGYFTVSEDLCVVVNKDREAVRKSTWCASYVLPYNGQPIRKGTIVPSEEALHYHWERIGFSPES